MIANYRFLWVDSDRLSAVYKNDPKSAQQKSIVVSRALSFLRRHAAALLPSKPVKAKKEPYRGVFDTKNIGSEPRVMRARMTITYAPQLCCQNNPTVDKAIGKSLQLRPSSDFAAVLKDTSPCTQFTRQQTVSATQ